MRKVVLSILVLTLVSGCSRVSNSSLNPFNWFDGNDPTTSEAQAEAVTEVPPIIPVDKIPAKPFEGRALIENLTTVEVRDVSGGVLVTAQGRPAKQGAFNLQLVREGVADGILTLAFRVQYPKVQTTSGGQLVTVAQFLSEKEMRGVSSIRVRGANQTIVRRN